VAAHGENDHDGRQVRLVSKPIHVAATGEEVRVPLNVSADEKVAVASVGPDVGATSADAEVL